MQSNLFYTYEYGCRTLAERLRTFAEKPSASAERGLQLLRELTHQFVDYCSVFEEQQCFGGITADNSASSSAATMSIPPRWGKNEGLENRNEVSLRIRGDGKKRHFMATESPTQNRLSPIRLRSQRTRRKARILFTREQVVDKSLENFWRKWSHTQGYTVT